MYCAAVALTVAIVQLDLWFSGSSLRIGNVLYIGVLGLAGLALWLTVDFQRQRAFFRQFAELQPARSAEGQRKRSVKRSVERSADRLHERSVDELSVLEQSVTAEQALYTEAWHRLYARLRAEVSEEHERNRRRIELITQWAHHMKTPVAVIDLELQKARQETPDETPAEPFRQTSGDVPDSTPDPTPNPFPDASPAQHKPIFDSIAEENERLRQALHTLLNMVRIDDFAADFKVEQVDLVSTVRDVVNEHRRTFITHNVYPKIEAPDPTIVPSRFLQVESDAKWLKFVLDQIVRNAIQYSARPGVIDSSGGGSPSDTTSESGHVTVTFYRGDGETVLEVADDGCGIAPEDIGRVFAPFFTGSSGRKHGFSTGMGLYLADETCRRLGHRLDIQSIQGEGTRVRIHFSDDRSLAAGLRDSVTPM